MFAFREAVRDIGNTTCFLFLWSDPSIVQSAPDVCLRSVVLSGCERIFGPYHEHTQGIVTNLAIVFKKQGKIKEERNS
jgi:hypothetical protein